MEIMNLINYFPQAGQIVKFDYVSMIFVAIIIVSLIIGVVKGLFSSLLSVASTLGSILISCVLCGYVGKLFYASAMGETFTSLAYNWATIPFNNECIISGIFNIPYASTNNASLFSGVITSVNIPISVLETQL